VYNRWYKVGPAVLEWFRSRYPGNQAVENEIIRRAPVELVYVGYSTGGGYLAFRRKDGSRGEIQGAFSDPPANIAPQLSQEEVDAVFAARESGGSVTKERARAPEDKTKKKVLYVGIGAGVAFAATVGYLLYKRSQKPLQANRRRTSRRQDLHSALKTMRANGMRWFAVRVPTGMERKAIEAIKLQVKMRRAEDEFGMIVSPEKTTEEKFMDFTNPKSPVQRVRMKTEALYPGYVYVQIAEPPEPKPGTTPSAAASKAKQPFSDKANYTLKSAAGVVEVLGGRFPTPIVDRQMVRVLMASGVATGPKPPVEFKVGDKIHVKSGPFKGMKGVVEALLSEPDKVRLTLEGYSSSPISIRLLKSVIELQELPKPPPAPKPQPEPEPEEEEGEEEEEEGD